MNKSRNTFVAVAVTGLGLLIGLAGAGTAGAASSGNKSAPVIYEQARAIPTRSGMNSRITLFTKKATFIKVRVNGGPSATPTRFGRGCGKRRCQKWKLYTERTSDSECYDLKIYVRNGAGSAVTKMTVCEPFPDGSI